MLCMRCWPKLSLRAAHPAGPAGHGGHRRLRPGERWGWAEVQPADGTGLGRPTDTSRPAGMPMHAPALLQQTTMPLPLPLPTHLIEHSNCASSTARSAHAQGFVACHAIPQSCMIQVPSAPLMPAPLHHPICSADCPVQHPDLLPGCAAVLPVRVQPHGWH